MTNGKTQQLQRETSYRRLPCELVCYKPDCMLNLKANHFTPTKSVQTCISCIMPINPSGEFSLIHDDLQETRECSRTDHDENR